jgi:hypothetical protein
VLSMSVSPTLSGETEPYYDLGSYHRPIDTPSPQAQIWFDRGVVWAYAFNHEESIRCFERALELDPDLAVARWYRLFHRSELQQGVGGVRPGRHGGVAGPRPDGTRPGRQVPGVGAGARLDRGPAIPLPHRRSQRHRCPARGPQRIRRCDGQVGGGVSRRRRRAGVGRRCPGERHRVGAVGHQDRRTGAGVPGGRGQADPGRCAGHAGRPGTPRHPASVPAHHGDGGHAAGRAARRRPAARYGARCWPPAAHAQPHRRAVR